MIGSRSRRMEKGSGSSGESGGKKVYHEEGGGSSSGKPEKPPPTKKGKAAAQAAQQPPRCQVEGCKVDLTDAKAYYSRHRVCGMHSKSPKVVVAGLEQRFCQQCSRFHLLSEFDQGKRSCRRRLAGHNERRRKPPSVPLSSCYGRLAPFQDESSRYRSFLMDFSYPRPLGREVWPGLRPSDRTAGSNWQAGFGPPTRVPDHGAHHCIQGSMGGALFSNQDVPPVGCFVAVSDSSCALSLLSTQPWCSHAPNVPPGIRLESTPMAPMTIADNNSAHSYTLRGHGANSSSHEVHHQVCMGHAPHASDAQFSSELDLALQGNRQHLDNGPDREYDQSGYGSCHCHVHGHGMHWSL